LIPHCERVQREVLFREVLYKMERTPMSVESKVYVLGIVRHKIMEGVKK
jgi:hypothetical protein